MLKKICNRCGKFYEAGSRCSCRSDRSDYNRKYEALHPNRHDKYNSVQWQAVRQAVIARAHGIDEYVWATKHVVLPANTIHHIVPIEDDESLWLRMNNLILVTPSTHSRIHKLYQTDKRAMQERLRKIVRGNYVK